MLQGMCQRACRCLLPCRYLSLTRRCRQCGITNYPGSDVYSTNAPDAHDQDHLDPVKDKEDCLVQHGGNTVYKYLVEQNPANLCHVSTCSHTFLRIQSSLWIHACVIETEIHQPVRHASLRVNSLSVSVTTRSRTMCVGIPSCAA